MTTTRRTILGVFDDPAMADQALNAFQTAGFSSNQVHEAGHHTSGGFMTGLKNFFTGDDTATDTSTSDFTSMGIPDREAQYYEKESQAGHRVVAIQANGREQEAEEILRSHGAFTYGTRHKDAQTTSATTANRPIQTAHTQDSADITDEQMLQLREEQLMVNKQRTQTGEVGLHKEIVTEQKAIDVPVTHEEAFIVRRAGTGAVTSDTTPIGEGENIRIPLSEEQVTASKETLVTGEVSIGKRVVEETQQVKDTVKREEARVEQHGDAPIHGTKSDRFHPESVEKETL